MLPQPPHDLFIPDPRVADPPIADAVALDPPAADRPSSAADGAQNRLDWRARRKQAAALRDASFDWLADGFTHQQIAAARKVSVAVVRRDIAKAIRARQMETREGHAQLQIARLTKGLALVAHHIERGDLSAVGPLVKVVAALDRYHGADAPSQTPEPAPREVVPEALRLAAAPLALTHAVESPALDGAAPSEGTVSCGTGSDDPAGETSPVSL
jgi:hypothetical protein